MPDPVAPAALPETMTAIAIDAPGGPEALRPARRPTPKPGQGEVVIRVMAAGVNRPDCLQRAGLYPPPPGASDLPGLEVAGVVAAVGAAVTAVRPGDAVCALTPGGGYAEYALTPAAHCLPLPEGCGMLQAAALPETFFTVWVNVFDIGRLQAGETLLVHGGSSGIGVTAIQLGKAFGATVIVTAGSEEKCSFCRDLGADHAINYRTTDWKAAVQAATGGAGVHVLLDMVAGDYVQSGLDVLAPEGRYLLLAFLRGAKTTVNLRRVLTERLVITGSTLRPRSIDAKAAIAGALRDRVWPLLSSGTVRSVIDAVFPLDQAAKAHALMESGTHKGKIVLRVAEDVVKGR